MSVATTAAEYIAMLNKMSISDEKYFAIIKLPEATKKLVVIYGIVTGIRPPKKSLTNEWSMALTINDPTLPPPKRGLQVMIFRSSAEELPTNAKIGDLYKCKVYISDYEGRVQAQVPSRNSYVFVKEVTLNDSRKSIVETHLFTTMKAWWKSLALGDDFGKQKQYVRGSEKLKMIKDTRPNQFIDFYCKILSKPKKTLCQVLVVTDFTANPKLNLSNEIVSKTLTPLSLDCLIVVSLWDNHSECPDLVENGYALLKNCRVKLDKNGRLEIAVNGDKIYPTKRQVFGVGINDPALHPLLRLESFDKEVEELQAAQDEAAMQKFEEDQYLAGINRENIESAPTIPRLKSNDFKSHVPTPWLSQQAVVATSRPKTEPSRIVYQPSIMKEQAMMAQHIPQSGTAQPASLAVSAIDDFTTIDSMTNNPKIPNKYRIRAKVIDHMPHDITNFTKSVCVDCRRSFQHSDKIGCPLCKSDKYPRSVYNFSLLLEDHTGQVPLVFHGSPASNFLQLPPTRLSFEALKLVNKKLEKLFEKGDLVRVENGFPREWIVESYHTTKGIRYRISEDQIPL